MTTPDTLNPYEQIWQSRDLKALESTPIKLNNKRPEWKKGLNAFVDEMQGTGYGLAALASQGVENVVGPNDITKGITDWGLEGYKRNMEESQAGINAPKIARVEDVHNASDAMDWASFQLGKGLPMLASLAVPAAIGGTIARFGAKEGVAALAKSAVGDTVKKAVATKALQAAEGDVVTGAMKQAAAKALQDRIAAGAVTGGYLGSFGLEGGQSFGETVGQGVKPEDAVKSAIAVGGINGALEFLPFYSAAKSIGLGQYAKKGIMDIIKSDAGLAKKAVQLAGELGGRAVKGGIVGAGAEGITEGLQELTSIAGERWAKNDPLFADLSEDDWSRVKNSMAAGAITGGVAMGAGATLGGPQKAGTSTDEGRQGGSSASGVTAPPKTREQEIEELRNKINTELEVAVKSGNTAKTEQLASARDKLDVALGREVVPPPAQEAPMQEPPVQEPIIQEAPAQQSIIEEVTPPPPDQPVQMQRGEEIILTPSGPETRVVPTEEEKVRLQELIGARPDKAPVQDVIQQEGDDVKYSMPLRTSPESPDYNLTDEEIVLKRLRHYAGRLTDLSIAALPEFRELSIPVTGNYIKKLRESNGIPEGKKTWKDVYGASPKFYEDFISNSAEDQVKEAQTTDNNTEYFDAVNKEDTNKLQELVSNAAKVAGYKFGPVQHGSDKEFTEFLPDKIGSNRGTPSLGYGFYFGAVGDDIAGRYGKNIINAYLKMDNPLVVSGVSDFKNKVGWHNIPYPENPTKKRMEEFSNKYSAEMRRATNTLQKAGYDSVLWRQSNGKEFPMVLSPSQIKSADLVVRDDAGNIIPLSKRFDTKERDIRYSMPLAPNMEVGEASMEEFEAIRKQFQERQKQETPFKNWFGKGVKGITATEDNTPITLYHGTNNPDFNEWDSSRAGDASGHPTSGLGFFMTADKGAAARYGNNLMAVHAKIQNPYTLTNDDLTSIETKEDANKLRKRLMAKGYDGAVVKAPGAKPYVIAFESKQVKFVTNESPTDSPDFRYSMPEDNTQNIQEPTQESPTTEQTAVQEEKPLSNEQAPVIRSVTPAEFRANIDSVMGEGWLQQAESAGIIQVVDGKGTRGEAGSWDGNTFKIYLQSMPVNGSPAGVLLHEGSHAPTFKQILGDNLEGFLSDLDKLASNGNKTAQKAIMHATIASANVLGIKHNLDMSGSKEDFANVQALIEEQKPGLLAEEKLAYFIQYGSETQSGAGFLRRLINAIKAWFAQTQLGQSLKAAGIGFELNEGMAVEWAKMSLQRSLDNAQQAAKVREQVVNEAKLMPPSVRLGRALAALDDYSFADEAVVQNIPETSLDTVRAQYENTDKWMKAPNGKDTKLNERQWLQVRTPEFKEWFGDWEGDSENASKVVDENGEPLVVYHGMIGDLKEGSFNFDQYGRTDNGGVGRAFYFSESVEYAESYAGTPGKYGIWSRENGAIVPVFLNVRKLANSYSQYEKNKSEYDGARRTDGDGNAEFAVISPTQIKSAIANTGEFSPTNPDIRYSMGIQELIDAAWTDPTDSRVEMVNKPGLLQRWRADFIDFFAEIEKKSKTVYDAFTLLRNKKAARLAQARQEYYLPLLKEIVGSKWTAKQVGDMLAARHHKVDKVNTRLAERASYGYTKELLKALPKTKRQELMAGRVNVKAGKMPDGKVYTINGIPATMSAVTKQKLMFDLMNKYSQFEITNADGKQALREEWEIFKDAAGGFSDGGVAKGMVRTVDDVLAPASEDQARFDRIAALFDAMNRHALQIREDGGLITADEHARLLIDKSAYAPLKRESYNVNTETMRLFQQAGRGGSKNLGTRAGTAELSEPTNVLQNAFALLEASAAAAERNLANQKLYKVVNADKAAWKPWFHIAAKDEYVTHDEDGFLQEKNSTAVNRADIVLIKDGKKIVIRPNMHNERAMGFVRAANNLDAQELSGPMKVLGMFNNLVRAVNITFSPIFLMMNAIKDPLTAAYNLQATEGAKHTKEIFVKDYFKTYRNSFRMLKKVFMDGNRDRTDADVKWVERYENAGGRTSFIEQLKENDNTWRSFDAQVARRQGNFKHLMAVKDTWIDGIENLNILFENVMRFSTFRVLVEKGMSDTDAARIAQDLTTNFSRRGYKSQALGLWWLFFNASVQGNYQVVRNLMKSRRLQTLSVGTIAFAVMLDLLGRAIADDWDEIPEWDKERFIIIPVKVGGDYVKIPAPWVYNTLWRTGGLIGEMFSGVKKPQDALLDIASMTATTFNPLGKPGSLAQAISPTAADPFIQILENKDFAGNPIGPEGYPGAGKKANSELLWSSTPKGYQSVARFVNEATGGSATESGGIDLKPGDYQLLAKFLTGSMGRFLTDSTFGFAEDVKKGIEGPKDIPVIREFFSDPYDPLTVQKYHTNIASIYGAHRLERMYREGPDRDLIKLQEVRSERGEELRMYSQAQDVERQLKSLRVRLKAAQARDDVGREKQLKERMAQVQEQFNAAYKQRVN